MGATVSFSTDLHQFCWNRNTNRTYKASTISPKNRFAPGFRILVPTPSGMVHSYCGKVVAMFNRKTPANTGATTRDVDTTCGSRCGAMWFGTVPARPTGLVNSAHSPRFTQLRSVLSELCAFIGDRMWMSNMSADRFSIRETL